MYQADFTWNIKGGDESYQKKKKKERKKESGSGTGSTQPREYN
jgi:hypothetical protein